MANTDPSSTTKSRKRRQQQGFVRVEVLVRKEDASLVRKIAAALCDPKREAETRSTLCKKFATPRNEGLKALLESVPLDGVGLERPRDFGRDIEF